MNRISPYACLDRKELMALCESNAKEIRSRPFPVQEDMMRNASLCVLRPYGMPTSVSKMSSIFCNSDNRWDNSERRFLTPRGGDMFGEE